MRLHIYFRHTDISRATKNGRPEWFSHVVCFTNLISTIENSEYRDRVIFHFIFDGDKQKFDSDPLVKMFETISIEKNAHIINGGDQRKAWRQCIELVSSNQNIKSDDLIYLLENDYVHVDGWLDEIYSLYASNIKWDIISLYDHPDKYPEYCRHIDAKKNENKMTKLYFSKTWHWKMTPSTCASYIIPAETFRQLYRVLKLGIYDYKLFMLLTKVFRKKLLSPIPSLSTHSMEDFLAPAINWAEIINEPKK